MKRLQRGKLKSEIPMKFFTMVAMVAVSLCVALPARAESPGDVPNPQQARRSWVADNADVLDAQTERKLDDLINGVKRKTGAEIAVVTVRSLGGYKVEDFANLLFNRWGIGRKSDDDGVLILAAISDRKLRIEVGDGAESVITDGQAGQIIRETIGPRFKAGDFNGGLYNGTLAIARKFDPALQQSAPKTQPKPAPKSQPKSGSQTAPSNNDSPFRVPNSDTPETSDAPQFSTSPRQNSDPGTLALGWLVIGGGGLLVAGLLFLVVRGARPPKCPKCNTEMALVPEFEEDSFLTDVQQLEESMGGREWNVWRCPKDGYQTIVSHDKWFSAISDCPRCGSHTATSQTQMLQYATEFNTGLEQTTHICHNPHCRNSWTTQRMIPRVTPVVITSSGGYSGHSSNSGGSSGSSHSSGSSGGGSFGGGHSSGGGASGSW